MCKSERTRNKHYLVPTPPHEIQRRSTRRPPRNHHFDDFAQAAFARRQDECMGYALSEDSAEKRRQRMRNDEKRERISEAGFSPCSSSIIEAILLAGTDRPVLEPSLPDAACTVIDPSRTWSHSHHPHTSLRICNCRRQPRVQEIIRGWKSQTKLHSREPSARKNAKSGSRLEFHKMYRRK